MFFLADLRGLRAQISVIFSRRFAQIEGADFRGFVFEGYGFWLGGSDLR